MGSRDSLVGYAAPLVAPAPADVARVDEARAGCVHLGDEGVEAAVVSQVRPYGHREAHGEGRLRGAGTAGDVRVPRGVDGDAPAEILARPPDVAGVEEARTRAAQLGDPA